MSVALKLYEQLTEVGEYKTRAKLIAESFECVEEGYPQLKDVVNQGHGIGITAANGNQGASRPVVKGNQRTG